MRFIISFRLFCRVFGGGVSPMIQVWWMSFLRLFPPPQQQHIRMGLLGLNRCIIASNLLTSLVYSDQKCIVS